MTKRSPQPERSAESSEYAALGASSSKQGVHAAVGYKTGKNFFAEVLPDLSGDPDYYALLHADGAGTKSIVAYIAYRETGDPSWFRSLAQDSLVMNLDDVACVGAFENLALSNTIGRNRFLVGDDCVRAIVDGYRETAAALAAVGVPLSLAGGETADVGDLVRTVIVDSTLFARVRRDRAVSFERARPGDLIVAISGTGTATYEREANSGIGSNGLTLARHALIARKYAEKYPEIVDPNVDASKAYRGTADILDRPAPLDTSIAKALLSPTRSYAPILKRILAEAYSGIHGIVHCSGGGQTKILHFGTGLRFVKSDLFPLPPIFELIQATADIPWREMYSVFNMGHRMEILCEAKAAAAVSKITESFGLEAKIIGRVEAAQSSANELRIESPFGEFDYA